MIMKFVATRKHLFWWPVTVRTPDPDNPGTFISEEFEMQFEALSKTEGEALDDAYAALETDKEKRAHEHDVARRVAVGWRGVEEGDGKALAFSAEGLEQMLEYSWYRAGIYTAYAEAMGGQEARRKN